MSILDDNPTTPEAEALEREVMAMEPRCGVWAGAARADLRALTQDQTDMLISRDLLVKAGDSFRELQEYLRDPHAIPMNGGADDGQLEFCQRGGIHSDPLVRVLAYRAWGERDRQWFDLRGLREGDRVAIDRPTTQHLGMTYVARAWPGESTFGGVAMEDTRPGECPVISNGDAIHLRVSDRFRETRSPSGMLDAPESAFFASQLALIEPRAHSAQWADFERYYANPCTTASVADSAALMAYAEDLHRVTLRHPDPVAAARELALTTPMTNERAGELVSVYLALRTNADDARARAELQSRVDRARRTYDEASVLMTFAGQYNQHPPPLPDRWESVPVALEHSPAKSDHRPGARNPGHKPSPPVPRWAGRRDRSQRRPGR